MPELTLEDIRNALELPDFDVAAAQRHMSPVTRPLARPSELGGEARVGGVLLLLYYLNGELYLVLTRRRPDLAAHPGQISFPGGRNEPPESLPTTALRETEEEIGMPAADVELLGTLTSIYIPPSDFEVHPFVGWVSNGKRPSFVAAPDEVAEIVEVPLATLLEPGVKVEEWRELGGQQMRVPHFAVDGHKVWGATAIILNEFVERLRVVGEKV